MSGRAPSAYAVRNAVLALSKLRERLLAVEPSLEDDPRLLIDMMDGEDNENHLAKIDRVIRAAIDADALADAAQQRKGDIAERQAMFERRRDVLRQTAFEALEALGLSRRETAEFTAFIANRPPRVVVTDEARLPPAYVRKHTEPDKAAIYADLKAGVGVPGATLSNPQRGISIRTR